MRLWILITRFDSRFVLKLLIAFNIVLVIYQFFTLKISSQRSTPCVIYFNNTTFKEGSLQNEKVSSIARITENISEEMKEAKRVDQMDFSIVANSTDRVPWWTPETRGSYSVLRDYIPSDSLFSIDYNGTVTLATQASYEYLKHSEQLCQRWRGPLSIAVYAPGDDFNLALNVINFLRSCKDSCIRQNVTWHFVYDHQHGPVLSQVPFPDLHTNPNIINCSNNVDSVYPFFKTNFRKIKRLPYPINVLRNVARLSSRTRYLLASDIELYPSINVIPMFMEMVDKERRGELELVNPNVPHVYVLPIFEVDSKLSAPLTKNELAQMMKKGNAVFFHKWVCDACQNFPQRDKWISTNLDSNSLAIFQTTKRKTNAWEPIYIGTNDEPLYAETLSWEGKRDKMSQMVEMCLLNYDLLVLDNAFLVHAPGIKHIDPKAERKRYPFIVKNNERYKGIIARIKKKYPKSKVKCAT